MADNNPHRGPNLTCSNEIRRLVVRASTEYNQSNSFISDIFKISLASPINYYSTYPSQETY